MARTDQVMEGCGVIRGEKDLTLKREEKENLDMETIRSCNLRSFGSC